MTAIPWLEGQLGRWKVKGLREGVWDEFPRQVRSGFLRLDARGRILGQCAFNSKREPAGCSLFV